MNFLDRYELVPCFDQITYVKTNKTNQILADYLTTWNGSEQIKETILPELEQIETGELKETEIDADVAGVAHINKDNTLLDMSSLGQPEMELPTEDFKGIVLEWVAFLEAHGF